jgi:hypothetical protein
MHCLLTKRQTTSLPFSLMQLFTIVYVSEFNCPASRSFENSVFLDGKSFHTLQATMQLLQSMHLVTSTKTPFDILTPPVSAWD